VLLSAIGCSDDDPRDPDLVIYEGCLFCMVLGTPTNPFLLMSAG